MSTNCFSKSLSTTLRAFHRRTVAPRTRASEAEQIHEALRADGWRVLGGGCFGLAFGKDHRVIKVVLSCNNQAYLAFARHCRASHAKFSLLPRVYQIMTVRRHALVLMERLHRNAARSTPVSNRIYDWLHCGHMPSDMFARARRKRNHMRAVLKNTERIRLSHRRSGWDLHPQNILFRKESGVLRPVFTDPITY